MRIIRSFLRLELEHKGDGILVHQLAYIENILKCFNIDKAYPLSTSMVRCHTS